MQPAAVRRDSVLPKQYLFESAGASRDRRAAAAALAASFLLHIPLLPLLGLWAPDPADHVRERDVTAVFDALLEEERIIPVDLDNLGCDAGGQVSELSGPAGSHVRFTDNARARGITSPSAPDKQELIDEDTLEFESAGDRAAGGSNVGDREGGVDVSATAGGRLGESGLTREEERRMRARWFAWYRRVLGQRIHSTYPLARLESRGVRGSLLFRLELAPDGAVKSFRIVSADDESMKDALRSALTDVGKFPPYAATGLHVFPPFSFRIQHGRASRKTAGHSTGRARIIASSQ